MGATTHSLEVNAPLRAVYNQWTRFEEFPRFMEGVREIQHLGARTLFWKVNIAGKDKEWEAEILEQIPDTRIVWQSVDGTKNRGMIAFEPLDFERTRVTLTLEYQPEGILEKAGDALGIPSSQVEGDLKRFRDFIEQKEIATGNRRDRIEKEEPSEATGEISKPTGEFYRDAGVLAPTHEAVARRAYELYLARGRSEGHDREDWLEAERQLSEATLAERPAL